MRAFCLAFMAVCHAACAAASGCPRSDLNFDCRVDLEDLRILAARWLSGIPVDESLEPRADLSGLALVSAEWLMQGQHTLRINEFMSRNGGFIRDEHGDADDWIEVLNYGSRPIDLAGLYFTDDLGSALAERSRIPAHSPEVTVVRPGQAIVLWADGEPAEGPLHLNFRLSADGGEDIGITDHDGRRIDSITDFPALGADESYGRVCQMPDTWTVFSVAGGHAPTPGTGNCEVSGDDRILITEIMYHPFDPAQPLREPLGAEYIELYNNGPEPVGLAGWRFSRGVDFVFPDIVMAPGAFLVVAADVTTFAQTYGTAMNVVGGWSGHLSNSGETVELLNAAGRTIDRVRYADEGDWAVRIRGPLDHGHRGWQWADDHDGGGRSLELVSVAMPNDYGQNWTASYVAGGTPGRANSAWSPPADSVTLVAAGTPWTYLDGGSDLVAVEVHQINNTSSDLGFDLSLEAVLTSEPPADAPNLAPMILDVEHQPVIPHSDETVQVTARLLDEQSSGITASVHYRADGQTSFTSVPMADDGLGADKQAGDGLYGAAIPAYADGTIVEFYVQAVDSAGAVRTWPAPCDVDGAAQQVCNLLYQVDDRFQADVWNPGDQPVYYLIMTEAERAELADIGDGGGGEENSDAQMNATFISVDGVEILTRYSAGVRNRGHGTRDVQPNNYRVNLPNDRPWKGVVALNLNTQYSWLQLAGSAVFQRAGLPVGDARAVQVRVNGQNLAAGGSSRQYGSYVHIEVIDSDYASHHFPGNDSGNAYKCMRIVLPGANLRYQGADPDPYRVNYFKQTNTAQDDWSDLIELTDVLNNTPDEQYLQELQRVVHLEQWLRFLALNVLLNNRETTLANGNGDDYYMYRGDVDPRFVLIQHDLDSIFGMGQTVGSATAGIFPMLSIPALDRMLRHPAIAPRYYAQLDDLMQTVLAEDQIGPLLDNLLGGFVPQATIEGMKDFVRARNVHVRSLIPSTLTVDATLPTTFGYALASQPMVGLSGTADAIRTRAVRVAGQLADWRPFEGTWVLGEASGPDDTVTLVPAGSSWTYLDDGSDRETLWREPVFDDSGWSTGRAQLGYGGNGEATVISYGEDASNKHITYYFRHRFTVADPTQIDGLIVRLVRDDGAIVYINGLEVARSNMPSGPVDATTRAAATVSGADETTFFEYPVNKSVLVEGDNLVAVEVHQINNTSTDLSFDLELRGVTEAEEPTAGIRLYPGINRVWVQSFADAEGTVELARAFVDIWHDDGTTGTLSGTLTEDAVLTAAEGPWMVPADVIVPVGVTLTVEAGATLFFSEGAGLTIRGCLAAEGTEAARIRMAPMPGQATRWDGIDLDGSAASNRLVCVDMEYGDAQGESVRVYYARLFMDAVTFASTGGRTRLMELTHPQAHIRNCVFPSIGATEPLHGSGLSGDEYLIFEGCTFGTTSGYNDIVDFTGGHRPGPIIQFYDNHFLGGGDDGPDLDGTDAHLEGNLFVGFHQSSGSDSPSHAIGTGDGSELCIVRNVFIDNDRAILHKEDVYTWVQNNTFIDTSIAVVNFGEPFRDPPRSPGRGTFMDSNILYNNVAVFGHFFDDPAGYGPTGSVGVYNSILPQDWHYLGSGNLDVDPGFSNPPDDLTLVAGSPAVGTGTNGLDMGAYVPAGASVSGAPTPISAATEAILTVGGPGITHYKWRLVDNGVAGPWSEEIALPIDATDYPADPTQVTGTLHLTGLDDGHSYRVDVIGKNSAGLWQGQRFRDTEFVAPGNPEGNSSATWLVDLSYAGEPTPPAEPSSQEWVGASTESLPDMDLAREPMPPTQTVAGGVIDVDTTWMAAEGPYLVEADLTVVSGATLTVEPGVSIFFAPGVRMTIRGMLIAEGQEHAMVRLTRQPGVNGSWNGLQFVDTMSANRIRYAVIEYADTNDGMIGLVNSALTLEHVVLDHCPRRRIRTLDSSLVIRHCLFTDMFAAEEAPATDNYSEHLWGSGIAPDGQLLIEDSVFGVVKGHNDAIDFDGATLPGPIPVIRNNTFNGSGDDMLDLEADAYIEGNLFVHCVRDAWNTASGESNVLSAGAGRTYWLVRNVFHDAQHVAQVKDEAFLDFVNNTVTDISHAAIYFDLGLPGRGPGRGAYVEGCVFDGVAEVFAGVVSTTDLAVHWSIGPEELLPWGQGNLSDDPQLIDPVQGEYGLAPTSPARGAGPNGLDMGACVPAGASISGEPTHTTWRTAATLTVGGPGIVAYRYRVNEEPWSAVRAITEPIHLTALSDGSSFQAAVLAQDLTGRWQDTPTLSRPWTVDSTYRRLHINEVLAANRSVTWEGWIGDLVELYYDAPPGESLDLTGMGLTDRPDEPHRFTFPAGVVLMGQEYLVLPADAQDGLDGIHLGYGLDRDGQGLYLCDTDGTLLDAVEFGRQVEDCSIGRLGPEGAWALTIPTFGQPNRPQATGPASHLRINEWFTHGHVRFEDDFIELFNASPLPVCLGGLAISDNPAGGLQGAAFEPLSFIGGGAYAAFDAVGRDAPGELNLRLSAEQGHIILFDNTGPLDWVLYGPQMADISQGRLQQPPGLYGFFELPTPGAANPEPLSAWTQTLPLMGMTSLWRYDQSDTDLGDTWTAAEYDDSAWPEGAALLYVEGSALPAPKNTPLSLGPRTFYFRQAFTLEADLEGVLSLRVSLVVDDGAVIHLNGQEILRIGMDPGEVSHSTLASRTVGNAVVEQFELPPDGLQAGTNVLAVEVHQISDTSSDVVFGLSLDAVIRVEPDADAAYTQALSLLQALRISEIMYNPAGGRDYEYVELINIGSEPLDVSGARLDGGVQFTCPPVDLPPQGRALVVNNRLAFEERWGTALPVLGEFAGNLDNAGENLVLRLPEPYEAAILRFAYDPAWVPQTDGQGYSLEVIDPWQHPILWTLPEGWRASSANQGTPGS